MKKERTNFKKEYKLFSAAAKQDVFRPALECVYFYNNCAYASDSRVLVRVPLSYCTNFDQEEYVKLNGFNVHHKILKMIYGFDKVTIERTLVAEDAYGNLLDEAETAVFIKAVENGNEVRFRLSRSSKADADKFEKVITSKEEVKPTTKIGISAGNLSKIGAAMNLDRVQMDFTTVGTKIYVTSTSEEDAKGGPLGIIMTVYSEAVIPGLEEENDD